MATNNQRWYVTYADARGKLCSVWLQLVECPEFSHVNNLMNNIDSRFQDLVAREQNRSFLVGELCIARYSEDNKCYRARVVRLNVTTAEGTPGIQVTFIDYGNTEIVGIDSVIRGGIEIFAVPALATVYYLADFQPANRQTWTVAESEKLRLYLLDKEVVGEIQSPCRPGVPGTVRLFDAKTMQLVVDNQIRSGIGLKYDNTHLQLPQFKCVPLKLGTAYQIHLSHFESPFNFWVHIAEHRPHYEGFLTNLQQAQFIAMREQDISVSKMCIAKCDKPNGDKLMCRAVISNVFKDQGKCSLLLVDYGLSVDSFFCDIGVVTEPFMGAPEMAVNCTLSSPEAAISPVQGLLTMTSLYVISQTNGIYTVSKFPPGQGPPPLVIQPVVAPSPAALVNPVPASVQQTAIPAVGISSISPAVAAAPAARVVESKVMGSSTLKLGEIYDIQVVNVEDSGLFFCHLAHNADKVETLKQHLLRMPLIPLPPPYISGMNCIVKRSTDGLPCRAQIASVAGGSIHVHLIDFGCTEIGKVGAIFRSSEEIAQIPSFAVCCALAGNADIPINSIVKLLRKYEEKGGICARFIGKRDGLIYEVEIFDSISRVVTLIEDSPKEPEPVQPKPRASIKAASSPAPAATSPAVAKPSAQRQSSVVLMTIGLDVGRKEKLFTTAVYSGTEFFGQLSCYSSDLLDDMQEELNTFYKQGRGRNLVNTNPGELCATTFSGDDNFYRTRILKLDGKNAQVLFIDYGNIEDKPLQVLCQLDTKFIRLPIQGIRCRLGSSRAPKDQLESTLLDKDIIVMVEGRDGDTYEVSTPHCSENDAVNKLLQRYQGAASSNTGTGAELTYVTLEAGKREKVAVTYVQDPEHIYVQPLASAIQLETLMTKINTHCSRRPVPLTERPKLGTLVLATYPEDKRWYRGIIKGLKKSGEVEVQFVDFGNYSDVAANSVQAMQPDFLQLPAQALCCSLAGIQQSVAWSSAETDLLFSLLQEDAYFIVCTQSTPRGDSWSVHITDHGGRNINQIFGQKTNKLVKSQPSPSGDRSDFVGGRGNERGPRGAAENGGASGGFQRNGEGGPRGGPQGGRPEGGFGSRPDGGRPEGGFGSRPDGGRPGGGFGSRPDGGRPEGGFGGRQERQDGGFQGRQEGGGFQGRQEGGFRRNEGGPNQQDSGFGNNERGGFQRRDNAENGFSQRSDGPPRRNEGGFGRRENDGGFQKRDGEGGFQRRDNEGGFQRRNEGGFQKRDNEGGFQKRDNEGGFQKRDNEGGFQKRDNEGGFQKRGPGGREGGFGNQAREDRGGASGFQRRDDNAGGGGFGRRDGGTEQRGSGFGQQGGNRTPRDGGNNQSGGFGGRAQRDGGGFGGRQTASESWGDEQQQTTGVTPSAIKGVSLNVGQVVNVYAAFVVSPGVFWCQTVADSTPLDQFMATMRQELTSKPNEFAALTSPKVGDFCYSIFSDDGQWYRAKILSVTGDSAEVLYIDYGNSETVSVGQLKKLQPKHCELHAVAFKCQLSGVNPVEGSDWSADAIAKLEELIMEQELKCKIVASRGDVYEVELTNGEDARVGEQLISSGLAKVAVKKPETPPPQRQQQPVRPGRDSGADMKVGQYCDVSVVYITSPQSFVCQLVKFSKDLSSLMDSLRKLYSAETGDSAPQTWEVGSQVCCKFSVDEEWYRGKVLEVADNKVRVYFIDYGNDEWAELSAVRPLQAEFRALKPMAISCTLAHVKPVSGSEWSEEAINIMEELTIDKQLVAHVVATDPDGKMRVHLVDAERTNIGEELVKRKLAMSDAPPPAVQQPAPSSRSQATTDARYVKQASGLTSVGLKQGVAYTMLSSWANSVKDFYLQLSSESGALSALAGSLFRRYSTLRPGELTLSSPAVGQVCVAKFAADSCWYRAIVVEVGGSSSVRVFFIDYGNTESVAPTDLKLLETEFAQLPRQAYKCALNLDAGASKISAAKLKAQLARSPLTCNVVDIKGDTHVMDIVNSGGANVMEALKAAAAAATMVKPVAKDFAPCTVLHLNKEYEVTVSHVENSDAIYCQRNDSSEQLDAVMEALKFEYETSQSGPSAPVKVGQPCAAVYAEDGAWYRGLVLSEEGDNFTVRFVDYGNVSTVPMASVRPLTAHLATPGPLAIRCSLRGVPVNCTGESVKEAIDGVVSTESETPVKIVVHYTTPSVALVTMTVAETEVATSVLTALSKENTASLLELTVAAGTKLSEGDKVLVSSYNTVRDFWVQLKSNEENIQSFAESLQAEYDSKEAAEVGDVVAGRVVCAKSPVDSKWYRAVVLAGGDNNSCLVTFVDNGNSGNVPLSDLRILNTDHATVAAWAIHCTLAGVPEVEGSLLVLDGDSAKEALGGQVTVEAASDDQPSTVILNTADGANITTLFKFVTLSAEPKQEEKRVMQPLVPGDGERQTVLVSYVKSAGVVCLQVSDRAAALETLTEVIQAEAEELPELQTCVAGDYSVAQFSEDRAWYRAAIEELSEDGETATVRFVDFGNSDKVLASELRQLSADLVVESAFAIECDLALEDGFTASDLSDYVDAIRAMLDGQEVAADFLPNDTARYQVKLWQGDTLLNANIVDLARPENKIVGYLSVSAVPIPVSSKLDVSVSYVVSPGQFWIQQASMADSLQLVQDGVQSYATSHLAQSVGANAVEVGTMFIGQSTDDDMWYRCQVTGVSQGTGQVAVNFIDFGNSEMLAIDRLRRLPTKYSNLPVQAVECSLSDVEPTGIDWSDETYDLFSALVSSRTLEACVGECSETGVYQVQLLHEGASVGGNLVEAGLAKTRGSNAVASSSCDATEQQTSVEFPRLTAGDKVEVRVTSCVSPDNFWCQVVSESSELPALVTQLTAYGDEAMPLVTPTVGVLCVAKFTQDSQWYRAVVTDITDNEATVCFIDYGNTDVVGVGSLKVLKNELKKPAMQAFRCRLAGIVKEESWDEGVCARLEELLVYDDEKTFTAEIVSVAHQVSGPLDVYAVLSLTDGQQSIAGALVEGGYAQAQSEVETEVRDYVDDLISQAMANIDLSDGKSGEEQYSSELVRQAVQQASDVIRSAAAASSASKQLKEGAITHGHYVSPGTPTRFTLLLATPSNTQPSVPISDGTSITCTLAVTHRTWSAEEVAVFEDLCKDKLLVVDVVGMGADNTHVVSLRSTDSDKTISELLEQTCPPVSVNEEGTAAEAEASFLEVSFHRTCSLGDLPEPSQQLDESETMAYSRPKFRVGDTFDVIVLSAVNPDNVVIRSASLSDDFDQLCVALKEKYSGDTSGLLEDPQKNQPCCVLVAEEKEWFRGEVVSVSSSDGQAVVNLVDRGVVVTLPVTDMRVLYPAFLSLPALAVSCSLAHLQPTGITWSPELVEVLQVFCLPSEKVTPVLSLTVIDFDEQDRPLISLTKNGVDLASTLQHYNKDDEVLDMADEHDRSLSHIRQEGVENKDVPVKTLPPHHLIVNSVYDALMTHIVSPSDIWCQVQSELLEQIMEQLQVWCEETKAAGDVVPELAEGDACCARSSINNVWYRAKVSVLDGSRYTVRFVDYGHEEVLVSDNLLPLPAMFAQDPPYAVACSLHGIKPAAGDWTEDSTVILEESVSVPFRMRLRRVSDDRVYVDLTTRDGDSLVDKLLAKSHSGVVRDDHSADATVNNTGSNDVVESSRASESNEAVTTNHEQLDGELAKEYASSCEDENHAKEAEGHVKEQGEGRPVEGGDEGTPTPAAADSDKELTSDTNQPAVVAPGGAGDVNVD